MGLPNRGQGKRGTCSVFALIGGLEYALAKLTGETQRLSVEYLNWAAHRAIDRDIDGGFFSELWIGWETSGVCSEALLPYANVFDNLLTPPELAIASAAANRTCALKMEWIKEWNPDTGLSTDQFHRMNTVLASGYQVPTGLRWPKSALWNDGTLEYCSPDAVFDGHSILIIGYRDDDALPGGGVFLIRNSGGEGSDGCLTYRYVNEYTNDAVWIHPG